jgi:tetratricopeptide (TPR) repeat protein
VVVYSFWRFRKTYPLIRVVFFGTAWFFVTLAIESSIIPIVDVIFEHRMYLPSFGVFLIISALLSTIIGKCRGWWMERLAISAVLITILLLTGATYSRNHVWSDKILLWQSVVDESPGKARGYVHLGSAHFERGNYDMAINNYKKAIYLAPSLSSKAYSNLGNVYGTLGRDKEAIKAYSQAVRINPSNDSAYIGLGTAMVRLGLIRDAISEFNKAKKANPYNVKAYNNLGVTFGRLGRTREAINEFRAALQIRPNSPDILFNLGKALGELQPDK